MIANYARLVRLLVASAVFVLLVAPVTLSSQQSSGQIYKGTFSIDGSQQGCGDFRVYNDDVNRNVLVLTLDSSGVPIRASFTFSNRLDGCGVTHVNESLNQEFILQASGGGFSGQSVFNYIPGIAEYTLAFTRSPDRRVASVTYRWFQNGLRSAVGSFTLVDPTIVSLDSDGDGVVDGDDLCPGTPVGTPVDSDGCPMADLVISRLQDPPSHVSLGSPLNVSDTVGNLSVGDAIATETHYFLSADGIDPTHFLGSSAVGPLAASHSLDTQGTLTIPRSVEVRPYFLLACVDATSVVQELNEQNNCRSSASQVLVKARAPVIVIPGMTGSSLLRGGAPIWLAPEVAIPGPDAFLENLRLDASGNSEPTIEVGGLFELSVDVPIPVPPFTISVTIRPYEALLQALVRDGYELGVDLFVFPYDWRADNRLTADRLRNFVDATLPAGTKADFVVHSMGGLVAREYARRYGNQAIGRIIYLATPHGGSAKSFLSLAFDDSLARQSLPAPSSWIVNARTLAGLSSTFPSVYQLLPRGDFITSSLVGGIRLSDYGLWLLRSTAWLESAVAFQQGLGGSIGVPEFNVVGSGIATLDRLTLFGDPKDFATRDWCAFSAADGDGTVTAASATSHPGQTIFLNRADHLDVPTRGAEVVLKILNDDLLSLPPGASTSAFDPGSVVSWCTGSPVKVTLKNQAGDVSGVSPDGGIKEGISGGSFFVFERNEGGLMPGGQPYEFSIAGVGDGVFSLKIVQKGGVGGSASSIQFFDVPIAPGWTGTLRVGPGFENPQLQMDRDGDGLSDASFSPTLPCDVDADRDIDQADLVLVRQATRQLAKVADPRDGNGDGRIDVADLRYCQLRLTAP